VRRFRLTGLWAGEFKLHKKLVTRKTDSNWSIELIYQVRARSGATEPYGKSFIFFFSAASSGGGSAA